MPRRLAVWNGTWISPDYQSLTDIREKIRGMDVWGVRQYEWIVKAGEGGTWQAAWDNHPMAIGSASQLRDLRREGLKLRPRLSVTPYINLRGREEWWAEERSQIVQCAMACGKVVLDVESGPYYWNGPTNQRDLQDERLWPLESELPPGVIVQTSMVPRQWTMEALGGLPCYAAWMAFAQRASWQMYDAIASDLAVDKSLERLKGWAAATGWGGDLRHQIPTIQAVRLEYYKSILSDRSVVEVWHLDS